MKLLSCFFVGALIFISAGMAGENSKAAYEAMKKAHTEHVAAMKKVSQERFKAERRVKKLSPEAKKEITQAVADMVAANIAIREWFMSKSTEYNEAIKAVEESAGKPEQASLRKEASKLYAKLDKKYRGSKDSEYMALFKKKNNAISQYYATLEKYDKKYQILRSDAKVKSTAYKKAYAAHKTAIKERK